MPTTRPATGRNSPPDLGSSSVVAIGQPPPWTRVIAPERGRTAAGSDVRLDPPGGAVGPVFEDDAQRAQPVPDLVGELEVLLLAELGTQRHQQVEQGGGQAILGVGLRPREGIAEESEDLR